MRDPFDVDREAPVRRRPRSRLRWPLALAIVALAAVLAPAAILGISLAGAAAPTEIAPPVEFDVQEAAGAEPERQDRPGLISPRQEQARADSTADEIREATIDAAPAADRAPVVAVTSGRLEDVATVSGAAPVGLVIPALGIDAPVVAVGYRDGEMEIPPTAADVGWYRHGPGPGEQGSSVLAAHVAWNGSRGVFWDLSRLEPGTEFAVQFDDGSSRRFRAVALSTYGKTELPGAEIFRRTGDPVLTLITCGGAFNPSIGRYDSNVVVEAIEILEPGDLRGPGAIEKAD